MKFTWQDAEKEKPPIGHPVLVSLITPIGNKVTLGYFRGGGVWHYTWSTPFGMAWTYPSRKRPAVTYWMRLPTPTSRGAWINADKEKPDAGQRVIVLLEGHVYAMGSVDIDGNFYNSLDTISTVTHWRNLPLPR